MNVDMIIPMIFETILGQLAGLSMLNMLMLMLKMLIINDFRDYVGSIGRTVASDGSWHQCPL